MSELVIPSKIVNPHAILPHPENYNTHPPEQISELEESLEVFKQFKNIVVWSPEEIIELESGETLEPGKLYILAGHGLWQAAMNQGASEIEVKDLTGLTYEEALLLMKIDNAAPQGSIPDQDKLMALMAKTRDLVKKHPRLSGMMEKLRAQHRISPLVSANNYTRKIESPVYEITGAKPSISELYDFSRVESLLADIDRASIPEEEKHFLRAAAYRHTVINFKNVAEYYAHAEPELQELMEDNALIIIDFERAIELGFVQITEEIIEMVRSEYGDE